MLLNIEKKFFIIFFFGYSNNYANAKKKTLIGIKIDLRNEIVILKL